MNPKVSICIPAYRAPEYFRRTLESVAIQDYADYEVIVTDDTEDDSLRDIVASVSIPAPVTYLKNPRRLGAPQNWNHAVGLARGEYVKILHHDDWFLSPASLARFVALMEDHPAASLGFCAAENYDRFDHVKFVHRPSTESIAALRKDRNALFFQNLIGPPSSIIYRRGAGVCFDEKLKWLVDLDFYLQLLEGGKTFAFSADPLVGVTVDGEHQVTRECEHSKSVELFEYLYLYAKISNKWQRLSSYMKFFAGLFRKYSIASAAELAPFAPGGSIPVHLKVALFLRHRI